MKITPFDLPDGYADWNQYAESLKEAAFDCKWDNPAITVLQNANTLVNTPEDFAGCAQTRDILVTFGDKWEDGHGVSWRQSFTVGGADVSDRALMNNRSVATRELGFGIDDFANEYRDNSMTSDQFVALLRNGVPVGEYSGEWVVPGAYWCDLEMKFPLILPLYIGWGDPTFRFTVHQYDEMKLPVTAYGCFSRG